MRAMWLVVLALMVPAAAVAQGHGPDQERRAELERQVRRQFMMQMSERLGLAEEQRERVSDVLAESAEARRELALESHTLRMELMQAVQDEEAPMSRFETILERLEAVRAREREIEQQEEAALAEILDPRQRAVFLMMRMQFNARIRQMRGMRGGGPPSGPGAGPGGAPPPFI